MRMNEHRSWWRGLPDARASIVLSLLTFSACDTPSAKQMPESDAGILVDDASSSGCRLHQECVDQYQEHYICRAGKCVSLLSDQCELVRGDDTNDDAIFIGLLAPDAGKAQVFATTDVVRKDFAAGLPVDGRMRPLVLVGCTFPFGSDPLPAARHLTDEIGVPAIVGPATSSDVINVAQNVAIPAGTLLISPYAQSDLLTELADQDLVFRTAARTTSFAPLLAAMLTEVEALINAQRTVMGIKVALVSARDTYGIALSEATTELLRFNGKTADENLMQDQFLAVSYDATVEGFEADVAERVIAFAPDVIVSLSGFDARPFKAIEESWPAASSAPPYYVMDGIGGSMEYAAFIASQPDSLRLRVRLVSNGDPERSLYLRYEERVQRELAGAPELLIGASAYDATYAIAYGIVAAAERDVTGQTIAKGLRRLVGKGEPVVTFPSDIARGLELLGMRESIDLEGVSGPLDFDQHGDVSADSSVSCYVRDEGGKQVAPVFSGQVYRVSTGKLEGSFECE